MEEVDQTLVQQLCEDSPRFRMLYEEHILFEKQLQDLDQKRSYLTPEEEMERKKVQKLKLAGKDEMERILGQNRQ